MNYLLLGIFDMLFIIIVLRVFMRMKEAEIQEYKVNISIPQNKLSRYFYKRRAK